jgi:HSP20 family protein
MAKTLRPWSHVQPLEDFQREIDELFSRFVGGRGRTAGPILAPPPIEFLDGSEYVIRLDLPGIDPKDIEVTVTEDIVLVRASRQHHDWDFIHCELTHGGFERSVILPHGIRAEDVKATYNHDALELRMPAPKEAAGRKVPIQVEPPKAKNSY